MAAGLVRLGVEPVRVPDLAEAIDLVKSKAYALAAVVLPSDLPPKAVARALKAMRRREPVLPAMAYGKPPEEKVAKALRRAGVLLALWDGYHDATLRFQLNRLVAAETPAVERSGRRVPVQARVRIEVGGRQKEGMLYSLAGNGCFIETPRASMDGARLRVVFELGDRGFELEGRVVFANVPGNLQRPNLPLGMGVRFESVPDAAEAALAGFIASELDALEV